MSDPTTSWIAFEDRAPTQDEIDLDRVVGYFRIENASGEAVADHFGKLFWVEDEQTCALEICSNALRLSAPGQFGYEPVNPSHWCLVPPLPNFPGERGFSDRCQG